MRLRSIATSGGAVLAVLALSACSSSNGGSPIDAGPCPPQFHKHDSNPVLPEGAPGVADHWRSDPFVLFEDGIYQLWFGYNAGGAKTQIGYATSPDGLAWTVEQLPAVTLGADGAWDDEDVETPFVVKANDIYHLYYCARGEPEGSTVMPEATYRIGHATSVNGADWIKDPANPVLDLSAGDAWDALVTAEPSVVVRDGQFELFYVGGHAAVIDGADVFLLEVGLATSTDGSTWTRYEGNPVLANTPDNVMAPFVLFDGGRYELWYTAGPFGDPYFPTGPFRYYTSDDGRSWTPADALALERGESGSWDAGMFGPTVLVDGQVQKMWYSGYLVNEQAGELDFAIGYAERSCR